MPLGIMTVNSLVKPCILELVNCLSIIEQELTVYRILGPNTTFMTIRMPTYKMMLYDLYIIDTLLSKLFFKINMLKDV